jgi:acyl-CoA synthetase (AMP-forming)/AMP-acid ligase II
MTALSPVFTYGELPYQPTVPAMWAAVVDAHRDRDFVVSSVGDGTVERITYGEAHERSALTARRLLAAGVTKGNRVGILAPNGPEFVVAFLAITRIGAVAVPINTFFQAPEIGWVVRDADLHTVLAVPSLLGKDVGERLASAVPGLVPAGDRPPGPLLLEAMPHLRHALPLDGEGDLDEPAKSSWPSSWPAPVAEELLAASERSVRPADDMVVIYTSGSTAAPKGVVHVHGTAIRHSHFIATEHGWTPDDRVYIPMAFFWVGGLIFGVLGPLQTGVAILTEHRFEPGDVLRLLANERATYATGFPHVGPALANHPDFATTDLSSLREGYQQVLLAPEHRTADPSLRVAQLGMTETCSSHTWWPPHEQLPEAKRGSLGVAAPGYEHKIVDDEGATVPDGTVGEICVRGDALMRGMVGRLRSEILDVDGWYHTGDSAHRDADGHLYFAGRTDDMVKTSGANVAPVEVETVLNRLPAVRVAYVVGVPDPDRGALVAAVVVLNDGASATADELTAACKTQLAAYKVPKRWEIHPDPDGLPYTSTNKIDKRALVDQLTADGADGPA